METATQSPRHLDFRGGAAGALAPFVFFLLGVVWLGLSGAPDERGFWPILVAALTLAMLLARDRRQWADTVIAGMSQPIVLLMIMAWLLAGVLAALMNGSGFVEALVWLAGSLGLTGGGFVAAAFLICCLVSTATGTSLGTIILCAPLLYPAAGVLAADPVILMGAILGGATFGDNISPVSDTTIASATTQGADMGGVVRSRMRYALPAAAVALVLYMILGGSSQTAASGPGVASSSVAGGPQALPMLLAPLLVVVLLIKKRHLLEGLLTGILAAVVLGLVLGLLQPTQILRLDLDNFTARGLVIDGMERGIGVSIFTILLVGLVVGLEASGVLARLIDATGGRARTVRGAELWIFATVSLAVLLTTHSVVAILAVGRFTREAGERFGLSAYRRANLLDTTVCTYPFIVPYCIPTVLAASTTAAGEAVGLPRLSPLTIGLVNFHSWALLAVVLIAVFTGYGRKGDASTSGPAGN
ncbi:MAG: Na+/H+ antiporter NhaC family protein [Thermoanaerobaculia bacterium]